MKSTQAWGWLAAGVLAAGLNAAYHDGGFAWAHRIADRAQHVTGAVVALASGHADRFLAEAQTLTAQNDDQATAFSDSMVAKADQQMARAEAAYARAEARQQAHCARMEAQRARLEARIEAHQALMRVREAEIETTYRTIEIPGLPATSIEIPQVKVHCSRVRMNLPAMPRIDVPAVQIPAVDVGLSSSGPA